MGEPRIHEGAIVEPGAIIGADATIWRGARVRSGAIIGAGVSLGQGVLVSGGVIIGDRCRIQDDALLFDGVTLDADVFVGPGVVFTNVRTPRAFISRRDDYRKTRVERGASLGANATIVCGVSIGSCALVGAGALVVRNSSPFEIVVGNPARRLGWACWCGERLPATLICAACGLAYAEKGEALEPLDPLPWQVAR